MGSERFRLKTGSLRPFDKAAGARIGQERINQIEPCVRASCETAAMHGRSSLTLNTKQDTPKDDLTQVRPPFRVAVF